MSSKDMEINKEIKNFIKLQELISRSTLVLRPIFMNRWKLMTGKEWLNSKENGIDFIKVNGKGNKIYSNAKKLQRVYLESGDIEKWDFTLIANVLQSVQFSICGQNDRQYAKQVNIENKKFESLSKIRNKCAHNPNMSLTDEEFNDMWNEMFTILVSLGESEEELELLKNKSIIYETDSNEGNKESNEKAFELKKIGDEYMDELKFKEAIDQYSEALAVKGVGNPFLSVLHSRRCVAYLSLDKSERGISYSSISGSIDQNDIRYLALMDAKKCLEYSPMWWRAYHQMGCAYHSLNKYSKAIHNFDRALALEPTKEETMYARDMSRLKRMKENREEHIDDRYLPQSTAGCVRKIHETGLHETPEMFKGMEELLNQFDSPFSDVIKGDRYRDGRDVKQDYELSAKYYGKSARKDNADGIYKLALLTRDGKGVKKDIQLAIEMLEKCAELPPRSSINPQYYEEAVAESQNSIGLHYQEGIGVGKNAATAEDWFTKASNNGSANGAHNLGLMYLNGNGVELNLVKAKQYLSLAATRKDPKAWESLAYYYLKVMDIEIARICYSRAITNGCTHAELNKKEFEKKISYIEKNMSVNDIEKFELENGLNSDDLTIKERFVRMITRNRSQEDKQLLTNFLSQKTYFKSVGLTVEMIEQISKFDLTTIQKYAKKGSVIAKRMETAINYMFNAIIALQKFDSNEQKDFDITFVQNFANSIRAEPQVSIIPIELEKKAVELVNKVLKSEAKSQLDIDSRVCYAVLHMNSLTETTDFVKQCTKKYPKELFFFKLLADFHAFAKNFREALNVFNKALKLSPNNFDLMFNTAAIMRLNSSCEPKDIINAYLSFIDISPIDHRFLPDSYYAIAILEFELQCNENKNIKGKKKEQFDHNMVSIIKSYYEKGLKAEENQLTFYMPYESNNKKHVELLLRTFETKPIDNLKADKITIPVKQTNIRMSDKLSDHFRIELIRLHREYAAQVRESRQPKPGLIPTLRQQKAPKSIIGLKPICLKDMDPTKDHIYEGFVMQITFIEVALNDSNSIVNIISDQNNDIQCFSLYNYENMNNDSIVQQNYGIGCKISLMNPYMCLTNNNGKPAIRVDDPKSLIKIGDNSRIQKMCRYCGAENAKNNCSRCKTALYCDRKCQENDWKYYKHKIICN